VRGAPARRVACSGRRLKCRRLCRGLPLLVTRCLPAIYSGMSVPKVQISGGLASTATTISVEVAIACCSVGFSAATALTSGR
jgi:hypothetical protein